MSPPVCTQPAMLPAPPPAVMPVSVGPLVLPLPVHAPLLPSPPPAAAPPGDLLPPPVPPLPTADVRIPPVMVRCPSSTNSWGTSSCDMAFLNSQSAPVTPRSVGFSICAVPGPPPSPRPLSQVLVLAESLVRPAPLGLWHPPLPSVGSVHHGTGRCKPCGWFWKAGGCATGRECCHCHLCPEGEIKKRRKAKSALIRRRMKIPAEHLDTEGFLPAEGHHQDHSSATQNLRLPTILGCWTGQQLAGSTFQKNKTGLVLSQVQRANLDSTEMFESTLVQS